MSLFKIAEIGVNHDGSFEKALRLIDAAKIAGANAVKFQSFSASRLATQDTPKVPYQRIRDGERTHFEMLQQLELSFSDQAKLKNYCESIGIEFISTPYSVEDAEFLKSLGVKYFKVASADIVDLPLLEFISTTNTLTLISTGMASIVEIKDAIRIFKEKNASFILMHTTSEYPTPMEFTNIARLKALKELGAGGLGFSDHTTSYIGAIMAVALECTFFEKHFTLDKSDIGPDHAASLEPNEFKEYVNFIENAYKVFGSEEFKRTLNEEDMARTSRKSLHFSHKLEKGHRLKKEDLILLRPGSGLYWNQTGSIIGKILNREVLGRSLVNLKDFE